MSSEWTPNPKLEKYDPSGKPFCPALPKSNPSLDEMMNIYLGSRGIRPAMARHNFWFPSDEAVDFHPRIVIPATASVRGNRYWQARYIGTDPSVKRYQCPAAARGDAIIVTYPIRPSLHNVVAIVEGPFDALAASMEGVEAIALMGVTPSDAVLKHVRTRCAGRDAMCIADKDAVDKMVEVMNGLVRVGFRGGLRVSACASAKDLNEVSWEERQRILGLKEAWS